MVSHGFPKKFGKFRQPPHNLIIDLEGPAATRKVEKKLKRVDKGRVEFPFFCHTCQKFAEFCWGCYEAWST